MNLKISKATACSLAGCFGVAVTGFLAFRAGKRSAIMPVPENETTKDKAIRLAKTYGPAVAAGTVTCASILAGDRMHVKKEMALGAAAVMWKEGYMNLHEAAKEVVGEEKMEEVDNRVKERMNVANTSDGNDCRELSNCIRVYEPYTDQYIYTTRETLAWTMLKANEQLQKEYLCTLDYVITKLGGTPTKDSDGLQWDMDSEILDQNWSYFNGPWIDIQIVPVKHGPEMVLELYYTVEPIRPSWEDKLYRESN